MRESRLEKRNHSEKREVMEDQENEEKNLDDRDSELLEHREKADLVERGKVEEDEGLREDRFDIIILSS